MGTNRVSEKNSGYRNSYSFTNKKQHQPYLSNNPISNPTRNQPTFQNFLPQNNRGLLMRKHDHRLQRDRLQELQQRIKFGAHGSATEEEIKPLESLRPMSVLEWRKSVWGESHRPEIDPQLRSQGPAAAQRNIRSSIDVGGVYVLKAGRSLGSFEALSITSVGGDDDDEEEEKCANKRFMNHKPSSAFDLSENLRNENKRVSAHARPPIKPLIDLNQARDSDGRPIDDQRRLIKRHTTDSRRIVEDTPDERERMLRIEIEQRHRAAIRRLQAEATDILEQARCEARTQQTRYPRTPTKQDSTIKGFVGNGSVIWSHPPQRSKSMAPRSLRVPRFLGRKRSEPDLLLIPEKIIENDLKSQRGRDEKLGKARRKEEEEKDGRNRKVSDPIFGSSNNQTCYSSGEDNHHCEGEENEGDCEKDDERLSRKFTKWIKKVRSKVTIKDHNSFKDTIGTGENFNNREINNNNNNKVKDNKNNKNNGASNKKGRYRGRNSISRSILIFSKNSDRSLSQSLLSLSPRDEDGYEII